MPPPSHPLCSRRRRALQTKILWPLKRSPDRAKSNRRAHIPPRDHVSTTSQSIHPTQHKSHAKQIENALHLTRFSFMATANMRTFIRNTPVGLENDCMVVWKTTTLLCTTQKSYPNNGSTELQNSTSDRQRITQVYLCAALSQSHRHTISA